jgi:hypothetical protein
MASTWAFWLLAILPGLLHPLLLWIYFLRFRERKDLIKVLLDRSVASGSASNRGEREKQKEEWKDKLDLNVPSFVAPVTITSLISIAGVVVIFDKHFGSANLLGLPTALFDYTRTIPTLAASAGFAGAYVWGLYDFVDRFRILSLPPSALHMIWFRLILGAVLGNFTEQLKAPNFAPVMAFALASLPVPSLLKWMQDFASQRFAIGGPVTPQPPKWELVQGLTPDIIDRLYEAGVTSMAHLGNQDPIRLLRGTNIAWRNILDMMDQAYLASYVGDSIDKLRCKGIRGSIEMAIFWQRGMSNDDRTSSDAAALVKSLAPDLGKDEVAVRNLARNLWEDPQVDRIWSLWWDRDEAGRPAAGTETGARADGKRDEAQAAPNREL